MDGEVPLTDEVLVGRCLGGDERAWAALVRRHAPVVFMLARRSVRRQDEAEDLVQDVFWKVSRMLEKYDRQMLFKPWMLQVTRRHLIDHHRSSRRERESTIALESLPVMPGSVPAEQHGHVLRRDRARLLQEGLAALPEVLREALVLCDIEGLEYDEIATTMGVPIGTVKSRINRARVQLANRLADRREELL